MRTARPLPLISVPLRSAAPLGPGVAICVAVAAAAAGLERLEVAVLGRAWLETLVLAILVGAAVRTVWTPAARWLPGVAFSAQRLLELAVALMGASLSARALIGAGGGLLAGIAAVVVATLAAGYGLGRMLGLPHRMATLIACGNAICGNSAIAAVAPVIGARAEDVTASIAFTAVLGVAVVLGLPMLGLILGLSPRAYGAFAGLTVYAVPQVLAATAPVSALAAQVGTVVKLIRVLMLGPVVMVLGRLDHGPGGTPTAARRAGAGRLAPWFILVFLVLAGARSAGLTPAWALAPASAAAGGLTVVSMAALGLGVDIRALAGAGPRATAAVLMSLAVLGGASFALIRAVGLA